MTNNGSVDFRSNERLNFIFLLQHRLPGDPCMNKSCDGELSIAGGRLGLMEISGREALRIATQAPHERLHLHTGFLSVRDGTITLPDYRALLVRLYGFYLPFERAVGGASIRTRWLEQDLASVGIDAETFSLIGLCSDLPRFDCEERRLGALYVVEGSALGGRLLCRGLDRLLGAGSIEGRRFFAGRGSDTGDAWLGFLNLLGSVRSGPLGRAAMVKAAVETFEVFESWLAGWSEMK